ncbi:MAG: cbb3-type cytochrome c oxidase subunit I [Gammaproteobacteria bacterium]|jgi:cytochrome c oxidase subunit 1|nr:cbb3-type cytochrome c oxidase subunit I [Gammaproteobacteria bacterium]MBP6053420.1 cbb3-type cytochrome c oxidase subunit I [Pseudomonadales bacterium]MBK6585175.1 cbb3-type cytochrome c oxidase subunit I [Gammaproteobacteria bacterium]MBK7520102.1 cbb3-type cytochrome c oxidase subunit I [Gammaproteobacteria bacterium]MBK7730636.1 cbb3-type cytochrome c oxidase subunit I [Gammaproteobacteria bacterium]
MKSNNEFRICPDTGLKFHRPAEALIKANAVAGVVFLLIGGVLGIGVGLTRWPEVHLLQANMFYQVLTAHGLNVLIFWMIFFEMAVIHFCSAVLLGCRIATPRIGWVAFALMVIGALLNNYAVLWKGNSSVMMTSYVPIPADTMFYVGLILFAVGALIHCFIFLGTLVIAKGEKTYEGSVPLVTFGALTAVIIAIFTIASGAIILIPTLLWNLGLVAHIDPGVYRLIWWAFGHSSQQINVAAHISVWYMIAAVVFGAKPLSEKVSRFAFFLYIAVLQVASAHHLLVDPGLSSEWKIFNTSYAMYLAVMASMVHGLTVPGAIEAAQRARGYNSGLFEWLRKAPWGNPVFSGMFISLVGFGVLGGITGVVMGAEQINLLVHNTVYVPGHFHATVVIGTTLTFMAVTYWLVPVVFRRDLILKKVASWQPYVFGLGMVGVSMFLMGAGTLGVPRRHWDILFTSSDGGYEFSAAALTMMSLNGMSVVLAGLGGAMFIIVVVGSLLFGRKLGENEKLGAAVIATPPAEEKYHNIGIGSITVPGTLVLVAAFFAAFVLYYFINWKFLGETWGLS